MELGHSPIMLSMESRRDQSLGLRFSWAMIKDLHSYGSVLLFADDTRPAARGGDPVEDALHAEHHFSLCKAWFSANKLKLNEGKT